MTVLCGAALVAAALAAEAPGSRCERPGSGGEPWRVVAVVAGEDDPVTTSALASMGANVMATLSPPSASSDASCASAAIGYLPRLAVTQVEALPYHPERVAEIRAMGTLVGLQYVDLDVLEGYESPRTQALAYGILKELFPDLPVVHAVRLDPIGWEIGYLERHYRPEFCDVVAPYFYPVGTTYLGTYEEDGSWPDLLRRLLRSVAARTPEGKPILPVLQAFEQNGHPVSRALPGRQLAVYREVWPEERRIAAFWWGGGLDEPLIGLTGRPDLRASLAEMFAAAPSRARPCTAPGSRPPLQSPP